MTEEATTETAQEAAPESADGETFDPERAAAKIKKANDEARNLRQRLKELEPLAQEAEQLRKAQMSESERLTQRAEEAERRLAEVTTQALRLEVAAERGLTPAQAKRLVGTTREELEADAAELLETFKPATDAAAGAAVSLDLGAKGGSPLPLNGDPLERALRNSLGIN